jgi:1-acyl-sn-glycerol-3-phosphate acyltransferase
LSTNASASKQTAYIVPWRIRLLRLILRPVFRAIFHLLSRVRLRGMENVPKRGPYLVAINHVSLFEPPFVLAFWPVAPEAAGAAEIWEKPGQNILARVYGGIQVHRGEYDRILIEEMLSALRSSRPLVIAPEGGRSHTPGMRRGLPGVAYLADLSQVPIIPVGIVGATDDFLAEALRFKRPTIEMRVGKPFQLPLIEGKGEARRLARQENADLIMLHIAELLPEEYHGVYAGQLKSAPEGETGETTLQAGGPTTRGDE